MHRGGIFGLLLSSLLGCGGRVNETGAVEGGDGGSGRDGGTGGTGSFSGGTGGTDSFSGGETGSGGAMQFQCLGPNPAGCSPDSCPPTYVCDTSFGCKPSSCACAQSGWACTADCGGGICVAPDCNVAPSAYSSLSHFNCTTTVRIDYSTLTIKGYAIEYTDGTPVLSEEEARTVAQSDSGFGAQGELVGGPAPTDEWIFFEQPSDFGGVAVVSARAGLTAFGGGIVWAGTGQVTYPKEWKPASDLGTCEVTAPLPATRGFDLRNAAALPADEVEAVVRTVWATAIPTRVTIVYDAVVLLYPPTVGEFDSSGAEYVVFVNTRTFF